jgi:hypothetical protein
MSYGLNHKGGQNMAIVKKKMNIPDGNGGFDRCHPETEVAQVVGLKEQYRQPSTAYTTGQIAYHSALPTGWYLECTTAGTSSSGELVISSPRIGDTMTDGTIVWTVNAQQNVLHQVWGQKGDFNQLTQEGVYYLGNADNAPFSNVDGRWTCIVSTSKSSTGVFWGYVSQIAIQMDMNRLPFTIWGRANAGNGWSAWVQQEAIAAKSLGINGYIKYSSGLIMQWGHAEKSSGITWGTTFNMNVSFVSDYIVTGCNSTGTTGSINVNKNNLSSFITYVDSNIQTPITALNWFAIGY